MRSKYVFNTGPQGRRRTALNSFCFYAYCQEMFKRSKLWEFLSVPPTNYLSGAQAQSAPGPAAASATPPSEPHWGPHVDKLALLRLSSTWSAQGELLQGTGSTARKKQVLRTVLVKLVRYKKDMVPLTLLSTFLFAWSYINRLYKSTL